MIRIRNDYIRKRDKVGRLEGKVREASVWTMFCGGTSRTCGEEC